MRRSRRVRCRTRSVQLAMSRFVPGAPNGSASSLDSSLRRPDVPETDASAPDNRGGEAATQSIFGQLRTSFSSQFSKDPSVIKLTQMQKMAHIRAADWKRFHPRVVRRVHTLTLAKTDLRVRLLLRFPRVHTRCPRWIKPRHSRPIWDLLVAARGPPPPPNRPKEIMFVAHAPAHNLQVL